jgi:hypothetical protein
MRIYRYGAIVSRSANNYAVLGYKHGVVRNLIRLFHPISVECTPPSLTAKTPRCRRTISPRPRARIIDLLRQNAAHLVQAGLDWFAQL